MTFYQINGVRVSKKFYVTVSKQCITERIDFDEVKRSTIGNNTYRRIYVFDADLIQMLSRLFE